LVNSVPVHGRQTAVEIVFVAVQVVIVVVVLVDGGKGGRFVSRGFDSQAVAAAESSFEQRGAAGKNV
jgi:hypothetical protein